MVHLIQRLGRGGASRAALLAARYTPGVTPCLVSLLPAAEPDLSAAQAANLSVRSAPSAAALREVLAEADIVHLHFWNNPELYQVMRADWPPARILLWSHIEGGHPPQMLPRAVATWADRVVVSSPTTLELPAIADVPPAQRQVIVPSADLPRLDRWPRRAHAGFRVGYLGTLDYSKLHPDFLALCLQVKVPEICFEVCGQGGALPQLAHQIQQRGVEDKFWLRGFVPEPGEALAGWDVLGHALAPGNFAAAELAVQEALYMGVPPVAFDQPALRTLVRTNQTGLLVATADEYGRAIEYLYQHPAERARLSANAQAEARERFSPPRVGETWVQVYADMLAAPKRARPPLAAAASGGWPGAEAFIDSLGEAARPFTATWAAPTPEARLAAHAALERGESLRPAAVVGVLLDYGRLYPDDGWLKFWAGLVLLGLGRPALALAELQRARRTGFNAWYVDWHLARAARACGVAELAEAALERVRQAEPGLRLEFEPDADPRSAPSPTA